MSIYQIKYLHGRQKKHETEEWMQRKNDIIYVT